MNQAPLIVGKITGDHGDLFQQGGRYARTRGLPRVRQEVRRLLQRLKIGGKKKSRTTLKLPGGFDQVARPCRSIGDKQNTEAMEAQAGLMQVLLPGAGVGEEFSQQRTLVQATAFDGHGAEIGFQKIIGAMWLVGLIFPFQSKNLIGYHSNFIHALDGNLPLKGFALITCFIRQDQLIGRDEFDRAMLAAGQFQSHHELGDLEGMFQKKTFHRLSGLSRVRRAKSIHAVEHGETAFAQAIDHAAGATNGDVPNSRGGKGD